MQKISSYLYPNRVELLADLAGFNVEYTNVYQRNVKIYNGIDNVIQFDIKNADQKRVDLTTLTNIELNVMDAQGNSLPNSPYTITPTSIKGIAEVKIPQEDLVDLDSQFLKYSVTALKNGNDVMLYTNSKFGAVGTIDLDGSAMPTFRDPIIYKTFTAEIDLNGIPTFHSSSIPVTYYEAIPTDTVSFTINVTGFVGSIWIDATTNDTINMGAFRAAGKPFGSWTRSSEDGLFSGVIPYGSNIPVGNYKYFRISYQSTASNGIGAVFTVTRNNNAYDVTVKYSGTNYTYGSLIKVLGSQLGGTDGVNDLIITVNGLDGSSSYPSSYSVGSIKTISWDGIAESGAGVHVVSGSNYSGTIDSITIE